MRVHTRTQLEVADDGERRLTSSTQLKFRYSLETADGQRVELKVLARLQQAVTEDEQGNIESKTKVKLQFSLLQDNVSQGLDPLLNSGDAIGGVGQQVAEQLQTFLQSVDRAVQEFVTGENLGADELVKSVVNAFNGLVGNVGSLFFGSPGADRPAVEAQAIETPPLALSLPEAPANESPAATLPGAGPPSIVPAPQRQVSSVAAPSVNVATVLAAPTAGPTTSEIGPIKSAAIDVAPAETALANGTPTENTATESAPTAGSTPEPTPRQLAARVLVDVRLRFVASMSEVLRRLSPRDAQDESTVTVRQTFLQASLRLRAQTLSVLDAQV